MPYWTTTPSPLVKSQTSCHLWGWQPAYYNSVVIVDYGLKKHNLVTVKTLNAGGYNYDHCLSDDLDLHPRSRVRLKLDYFSTCDNSDNVLSYYIQTWHDSRLMNAIIICLYYVMLVSMTLTLMQGHSGSANAKNQRSMLSASKQAISISAAAVGDYFLRDLDFDFANVYMPWQSCLFSFVELWTAWFYSIWLDLTWLDLFHLARLDPWFHMTWLDLFHLARLDHWFHMTWLDLFHLARFDLTWLISFG